jgi:carbamoylphosphate synthase small subunit
VQRKKGVYIERQKLLIDVDWKWKQVRKLHMQKLRRIRVANACKAEKISRFSIHKFFLTMHGVLNIE